MVNGRFPSQSKPQWRPGGSKIKPTTSSSASFSTSKRREAAPQSSPKNVQQWRSAHNNNDTVSEVGSVACSVMTPPRANKPPVLNECHEDSTAESDPIQTKQHDEDVAHASKPTTNGKTQSVWKLNDVQKRHVQNMGEELLKISNKGVVKVVSDCYLKGSTDPTILTMTILMQAARIKSQSWASFICQILLMFCVFVFGLGIALIGLISYSLVIGKLYVM
eukprot:TRINITY_DN12541_c0_g1_i3.p2 TRINITY_DN12541_c0_g1~~TRINITY_DN12541_c0_g1_i3.p2  ORF type:complete len:220 (-),score=15.45 TRINITY_DN12541_c0_g1_i3:90-749(-)